MATEVEKDTVTGFRFIDKPLHLLENPFATGSFVVQFDTVLLDKPEALQQYRLDELSVTDAAAKSIFWIQH